MPPRGMGMGEKRGQSGVKLSKGRFRKILLRLWRYVSRYHWMLILAITLTTISNLLALVGPMLSGYAIDAIEPGEGLVNFKRVFFYCALMVIFYVCSAGLNYLLSVLMVNLSQKVATQMRKDVFERLVDLPVSFFDKYQAGDIISCISYDIDNIHQSLSNDVVQICTSIVTVVGSLTMMLIISPTLSLVFAVTVPAAIIFTKYKTGKVQPLFRKRSQSLGALNGFVEEIITGQKTTTAYHQQETMISRFDEKNNDAVDSYYEADYYGSIVGPSVNFINNISLSLISVFGAVLYLLGNLSLGGISSFVLYSRKFSGPINEAANIMAELQSASAAADRVFRLIDEEPEPADADGAGDLGEVEGEVELANVRFGYVPERTILHNLSLRAEKGSLTAIVGHTGAGKTTIINLLMRFYDPQSGTICIDNSDIGHVTRASLRLAYAMVLQDTWLFHGTVYENIAYGSETATMEDVVAAAKAAKIHRFITQLPDGYDTILNEDGVNISQGQKQLMTIARAMLLDAHMLILDEATSNVDTRTEQQIQGAMRKLMQNKTCFVIAHRLSTIQNADNILVMSNGDVVEQGTHQSLLAHNGVYASLYQSQFEH